MKLVAEAEQTDDGLMICVTSETAPCHIYMMFKDWDALQAFSLALARLCVENLKPSTMPNAFLKAFEGETQ